MQSFNFGIRQSSATSHADDNRSRYVPSSVYSGPGPAEESSISTPHLPFSTDYEQRPFSNAPHPQQQSHDYTTAQSNHRLSTSLNISDPVAMHLLMETAISDSRDYEILSYEEVEQLKHEQTYLRGRIDAVRRKLALESKLRDAAQSLNRLYNGREGSIGSEPKTNGSPSKLRRRSVRISSGGNTEAMSRAGDEYAASTRKIEEYAAEISQLENRIEEVTRRILEHTAGILQMTHKGLKRNIRRTDLPRSPESMSSRPRDSNSAGDLLDGFDERSLYQIPEYVTDFVRTPLMANGIFETMTQPLNDIVHQLHDMNTRIYSIVHQSGTRGLEPPPSSREQDSEQGGQEIVQAQLQYMSQNLEVVERMQPRTISMSTASDFEGAGHLEDVNARLHDLLERTNTSSHSPVILQEEPRGKDVKTQLAFSNTILDSLNKRVETLVEQKEILTRQIQQQRELNTKSDAQRDAHIHDLNQQLHESKQLHEIEVQEAEQLRSQIDLLMDELDHARDENQRTERNNRSSNDAALQAERDSTRDMQKKFLAEIELHQQKHEELQKSLTSVQSESETRSQNHVNQVRALLDAKERAEMELEAHQADAEALAMQMAKQQSEHKELVTAHKEHTRGLQSNIDALSVQLAALESKHKDAVTGHEEQLKGLQADADLRASEMAKLESEHKEATDSLVAQSKELQGAKESADQQLLESQREVERLESEVVRVQTELTMARAELDGAYGTRAQRAAAGTLNPSIQKEMDKLRARNRELEQETEFLSSQHETKGAGSAELQNKVNTLQQELRGIMEDYESMTKQSIEFEKERDQLEETIDTLREQCEMLETQINEEKIKWLGIKRSSLPAETTSTMVLKNEFKKMMRDTRAENAKILKTEHEERRRLEGIIRGLKQSNQTSQQAMPLKTNGIIRTNSDAV